MITLGFDIATEKMNVVLEKDGEILANEQAFSTKEKYNSALLIPEFVKLCKLNHLMPSDIDLIVLNAGPGSFTGIRAGAVMARTMGQFMNVPVVGVASLEIYANAVKSDKNKYVILDARRNKWYTGLYSSDNLVLQEPQLHDQTEILEKLNAFEGLIITERMLFERLNSFNPLCFEDITADFAKIAIDLAKKFVSESENPLEDFIWHKLHPIYLQTPSITPPKRTKHPA